MLVAFGVITAFVPLWTGAVIQTGWVWLWLAVPITLLWKEIEPSPVHWLGLCFLIYACLSLAWTPHGLYALMQLGALASVFLWAYDLPNLRKVAMGLAFGLGVSAVVALFQIDGIQVVYRATPLPSGLFINSNVFCEISALVLVLLLVERLYWFIPVTLPGLLMASRATILALGACLICWIWSKSRVIGSILIGLGLGLLCFMLSFDYSHIDQRFGMWLDTWHGMSTFGHGVGSFDYLFPFYANHLDITSERPQYAHNDLIQLVFEFGIGCVPLLAAFGILAQIRDNHRYVLLVFAVISCFGFPIHIPAEAFILAVCAGSMVRNQYRIRLPSVYRGPALFDWVEAGAARKA